MNSKLILCRQSRTPTRITHATRHLPSLLSFRQFGNQSSPVDGIPKPGRYLLAALGGMTVYNLAKGALWWPLALGAGIWAYSGLKRVLRLDFRSRLEDGMRGMTGFPAGMAGMREKMAQGGSAFESMMRQAMEPMRAAQQLAEAVRTSTVDTIKAELGGKIDSRSVYPVGPAAVTSVQQTLVNGFAQTRIEMEFPIQLGEEVKMFHVAATQKQGGVNIEQIHVEENGVLVKWRDIKDDIGRSSRGQTSGRPHSGQRHVKTKPPVPGVIDVDFKEIK